jgi:microcystin-dependent protein
LPLNTNTIVGSKRGSNASIDGRNCFMMPDLSGRNALAGLGEGPGVVSDFGRQQRYVSV